ncbi:MAG TPA: hypothetical protein PKY07_08010 [Aliarcobacter cryaerophilus]|nr:hypothetical protein [Aliarcobacter cryaerophilus]
MKKLLIGFVVLIVAGAIFFTINRSVDKAVNLKIEELNQNGFSITQNDRSKWQSELSQTILKSLNEDYKVEDKKRW